jgi:heme-degrading monooxygenase HmoA
MFAVIFEVQPRPDRWEDYLALAGSLQPELEQVDGFLENERFRSRQRAGRVLSLSIWRDEKAVIRWRTLARHHRAQARGRSEIFEDYHLRVGEIVADSRLPAGHNLSRQRFDDTEIAAAKLVTVSKLAGQGSESADLATALGLPRARMNGAVEHETFAGINDPHKTLLLASWIDGAAGEAWRPMAHHADLQHQAVRVIRDYGMSDRREAPQYYPPVTAAQEGG